MATITVNGQPVEARIARHAYPPPSRTSWRRWSRWCTCTEMPTRWCRGAEAPPAGALAWKHADPTEEARWVYGIADAREIAAADPSLLVWVDPVWSEQSTEHECLDCGAWVACDASVGLPPCEASCHACRAHDDTCPAFWHAGDRCEAGIPGTGDYDTGTIAEEINEYSALVSWDSGVRTPVDLADLREIDPERMERTAAALRERGDAAG